MSLAEPLSAKAIDRSYDLRLQGNMAKYEWPINGVIFAGLILADASKYAPSSNAEQLLELNYQWSHSRYLAITPHGEFLWKRDSQNRRNATILEIEISLTL